ncbi:hypothetical protein HK103_002023 [Boothiomyces macroporosus]|uniref:Uncharacterized protein n=1 Tax=Boothiomyces macroporosus TaxID=261099 RepID=A0AAD5Y4L0_9FUNG|nr:hypothetical protein HK103_002023 [Boothiomyces macroporosus]
MNKEDSSQSNQETTENLLPSQHTPQKDKRRGSVVSFKDQHQISNHSKPKEKSIGSQLNSSLLSSESRSNKVDISITPFNSGNMSDDNTRNDYKSDSHLAEGMVAGLIKQRNSTGQNTRNQYGTIQEVQNTKVENHESHLMVDSDNYNNKEVRKSILHPSGSNERTSVARKNTTESRSARISFHGSSSSEEEEEARRESATKSRRKSSLYGSITGNTLQFKDPGIVQPIILEQSYVDSNPNLEQSGQHLSSFSNLSSHSSINEHFLGRAMLFFTRMKQHRLYRKLKYQINSIPIKMIIFTILFLLVNLYVAVSLVIIPQSIFPQFSDYNAYHITYTLSGHLIFFFSDKLLHYLHIWILASNLSYKGCTLNNLHASMFKANLPGSQIRNFLWALSLAIAVLISYSAFGFSWTPMISRTATDPCIPAIYESINFKVPLASYLQGDVGPTSITSYAIPLADGVVGGWSAWPLANPSSSFSIRHPGYIYLMQSDCTDPYPATTAYSTTRTWTKDLRVVGTALHGNIIVYSPQNSIVLDYLQVASTKGYQQDCAIITKFFPGLVENGFQSDTWQMVAYKSILSVGVGSTSITAGAGEVMYYADFDQHEQDGYYHDSLMNQGILGAMAAAAHTLLMQYNGANTDTCDYFAVDGSGYLSANKTLIVFIQILVCLLSAIIILHIWWVYLMFGIQPETTSAYVAIKNRFRLAHDVQQSGSELFGDSKGKKYDYLTTNTEIMQGIKDRNIKFGFLSDSLEKEDGPYTGLGTKKTIVPIYKM